MLDILRLPLSPFGYTQHTDKALVGLNLCGYVGGIQWGGHAIINLALDVFRIGGVLRIVLAVRRLYGDFYNDRAPQNNIAKQQRYACVGHIVRGVAEIAGWGLILAIVDFSLTIFICIHSCISDCEKS